MIFIKIKKLKIRKVERSGDSRESVHVSIDMHPRPQEEPRGEIKILKIKKLELKKLETMTGWLAE